MSTSDEFDFGEIDKCRRFSNAHADFKRAVVQQDPNYDVFDSRIHTEGFCGEPAIRNGQLGGPGNSTIRILALKEPNNGGVPFLGGFLTTAL